MKHGGVLLALALVSLWLYAPSVVPDTGTRDDNRLESESRELAARHWHDRSGHAFPLFFQASGDVWLTPVPVYLGALLTRSLSSPNGVRWAAALTGVLDVLLLYVLAFALFRRAGPAVLAAVLLLTSPAHFSLARASGPNGVWEVPFLVTWLIGMTYFVRDSGGGARRMLAVGAAALAASLYSQPSAAVVVPFLVILTAVVVSLDGRLRWREVWPASATFVVILTPTLLWLATHREAYVDTFGRWLIHPAHVRNPLEWAQAVSNWGTLTVWTETFWDFMNPTHLFINDMAPAGVGAFVSPLSILTVVGFHTALAGRAGTPYVSNLFRSVMIVFIIVPLMVATFKEPRAIELALVVMPCGALLATLGAQSLYQRKRALGQTSSVVTVIAALIQFVIYYAGQKSV